jgi:signal transduction histidine kinase
MGPLQRRLLLPTVALAACVAAALAYVAAQSVLESRAVRRRTTDVRRANGLVLRLTQLQGDAQRAALSYAFVRDERLAALLDSDDSESERVMAEIGEVSLPPRGVRLWGEAATATRIRARQRQALVGAARAGDAEKLRVAFARWDLAREKGAALLSDFGSYNVTRLNRAVEDLDAGRTRALVLFVAVLAAAACVALAFAWYLSRALIRPLRALTAAAERVQAEQELPAEAGPIPGSERDDEVGVLARALETMTGQLLGTNAQLAEAVRARDEFLSVASHELRTPLTSLKLQIHAAPRRLREAGLAGSTPRWLELSQRQVDRLEALVNELLDVTRIRAGRLDLRREPVDLSTLVISVADRFQAELARGAHALTVNVAPGVTGRWDADRLDQVITNLLANAIRHAPGAPIAISLEAVDHKAVLRLRDGGPGIAPELHERMFERFERGRDAYSVGGLGLGLFIVRSIVEAHGGAIRLRSAPGEGTEFAIELPRD